MSGVKLFIVCALVYRKQCDDSTEQVPSWWLL